MISAIWTEILIMSALQGSPGNSDIQENAQLTKGQENAQLTKIKKKETLHNILYK